MLTFCVLSQGQERLVSSFLSINAVYAILKIFDFNTYIEKVW